MLIQFKIIKEKYGIDPTGLIHIGMHKAEEHPIYRELGDFPILFIEANYSLVHSYKTEDPYCCIVHAAVSDKIEEVDFHITNNGESSSILELGDHSIIYPHITKVEDVKMKTVTLDTILNSVDILDWFIEKKWNILNLDIQGAELKAMMGLTEWDNIQAVFTEINYREMYKGCALEPEVTKFLESKGLKKVEEVDTGCGWGDALYIRK